MCDYNTNIDGTEADAIHCFKEGQPCSDGKLLLDEKSHQLLQRLEDNDGDIDPFEDDEEAECNEVRVDKDSEMTGSDSDSSDSDSD